MRPIDTRPLLTLRIEVRAVNDVGMTPYGRRRVVDIGGGSFVGDRLNGTIRPSGADYALIRADGVFEPDNACSCKLPTVH